GLWRRPSEARRTAALASGKPRAERPAWAPRRRGPRRRSLRPRGVRRARARERGCSWGWSSSSSSSSALPPARLGDLARRVRAAVHLPDAEVVLVPVLDEVDGDSDLLHRLGERRLED